MPISFPLSRISLNGRKESPSRPKIFALPAGLSGCAFWRYRLPLKKLKKLGTSLEINIADNPNKVFRLQEIQEHVKDANIISIQSPGYRDAYMLMKIYRAEGKKIVIDYDDYSFDLSAGNPRYGQLGTKEQEILDSDGKTVFRWRDQENEFDLKANQEKYEAFKMCVESADLITTTTEYLADKFRKHNPNVAVCPNSVDFDLWRPIPRPKEFDGQIRIGWFGGDSHYVDLRVFKTLLPRVCARYPQVRIVIQAPPVMEWREFFKDIPQSQLEWYGWTDLRYYTLFLASRHFDIGLCPLEDNDFNRAKSSIKFYEFAALGAAVVAQRMLPYAVDIKHGENGLLAGNEDEWFEAVCSLIENEKERNRLAMSGYEYVRESCNLDTNCRIWEKAYMGLLDA